MFYTADAIMIGLMLKLINKADRKEIRKYLIKAKKYADYNTVTVFIDKLIDSKSLEKDICAHVEEYRERQIYARDCIEKYGAVGFMKVSDEIIPVVFTPGSVDDKMWALNNEVEFAKMAMQKYATRFGGPNIKAVVSLFSTSGFTGNSYLLKV